MPDDLDTHDPNELTPHEVNQEIYGDEELEDDFIQSIEDQGVIQPVVINNEDTVISGHRRVEAAKELGKDVPVRVKTYDTDLAEREAIINSNWQRNKSFSQKMREADELEEIEAERAEERQQDPTQDFAEGETGTAREKVAERFGWSDEKLRQAQKVWRIVDGKEDASDDVQELAQDEVAKLDNEETSVNAAYEAVTDAQENDEAEDPKADEQPEADSVEVDVEEVEVEEVEATEDSKHWVETAPEVYSDLRSDHDLDGNWQESVRTLRDEWPDDVDEGALTYVLAYLLEKDGTVSFSSELYDEGPTSLTERHPGDDVLELLEEGEETIGELGLQWNVHPQLVNLWLHEADESEGVESLNTKKDPFATGVPAEEDE